MVKGNTGFFSLFQKLLSFAILAYLLQSFLFGVYVHFLRAPTSWKEFSGEWAIITGASYGIGEQFAYGLAERGLNVVLLARSKDKLEKVEQTLHRRFPQVKTKILVADFSSSSIYDQIEKDIQGLDITVLINNVGHTSAYVYDNLTQAQVEANLNLNLLAPLQMTRLVLPKMKERNKGRILSLSSIASAMFPFSSIYAGTKAGLVIWSESLRQELILLGYDGIEVVASIVGIVDTPLLESCLDINTARKTPLLLQSPEFVELELNQYGSHPIRSSYPLHYLHYQVQVFFHTWIPEFYLKYFFRPLNSAFGLQFPPQERISN